MKIQNVKVFTESGIFEEKDICINNDRICKESEDSIVFDGEGCYAIPGLIDVHFHGCVGKDFCNGTLEAIQAIAEYELSQGVTSICPATMTLDEETLSTIFKTAGDYKGSAGAELVGINMEGPYISSAKKGAQNAKFIHRPDVTMFRKMNELSGGLIKLVALAPEEEGALEFIQQVKDETVISIAHTTADYETTMEAFHTGASHVTHLYNAMPPFSHRAPGVIGAAADCNQVYVELICDGIHIHPAVVRTTFKMFGDDRIVFISDSMEATGMPDGDYALGGQAVKKVGNRAELVDGTIAGSATNLLDCLRTAVQKMGIPLESAVKCSTINAAKSIGIEGSYGSISEGKFANIILLDKQLNLRAVFLKGVRKDKLS